MSGSGTAHVARMFADLRAAGRKALIVYIMAGDPTPQATAHLVPRLQAAGVDLVELGFPFSEPVADGPVIQAAGQRAMPHMHSLDAFFKLVRGIRKDCDVPMIAFTYYNPIFRYGEERFLRDAQAAGLDGAILPDLPIAEADQWQALCRAQGMAAIFLEAPNTPDDQARLIAQASQGFVYLVSLKGVTGSSKNLGENLAQRVRRFRAISDIPLAVGFGISTVAHVRQVAPLCDAVVVGSGVVTRLAEAPDAAAGEEAVLAYVGELRAALDHL
ncbi:MAG: tryptophan synthase subunit alpha [Candidatus Lambdaproteobacteria bacterium]|nr:tryptophan synthase subunit alpha [Candidatus Lambdaproteobacteria bacterium]